MPSDKNRAMREASECRTVTDTDSYAFCFITNRQRGEDRGTRKNKMENLQSADYSSRRALINVFGISGIGKTSTLSALYKLVKSSSSFYLIDYFKFKLVDFRAIFEYKGKRIGITTLGDSGTEKQLKDFLDCCKTHSCDRIYTASRTRGAIFEMTIDFANTNSYIYIETSPLNMSYPNGYNGDFGFLHLSFASMLETLI